MRIAVLVEPVGSNGFRARGAAPFEFTSEGATRDEAIAGFRGQVEAQLNAGAEIHSVEVANSENPWITFAGMFKDDPLFEEWKESMAAYRRSVEEDADYL